MPSTISSTTFDRFAHFYDADYRHYDDDIEAIEMLAAAAGDPVLELGCGTGRVLVPLALAGHSVTGVDISPALLAIAQRKLAAVTPAQPPALLEGDLRTVTLGRQDFAFAFCTSNTLMHLTSPGDQLEVLRNAHRHLRPGGELLLDLFNPDILRLTQLDGLMELAGRWTDDVTGAQVFKWSVRSVDWAEQIQETLFIYEEIFADGRSRRTLCPFTLRFLWRNEAELMLRLAGFSVNEIWGDFAGGDYDATSEHLILLAKKEH